MFIFFIHIIKNGKTYFLNFIVNLMITKFPHISLENFFYVRESASCTHIYVMYYHFVFNLLFYLSS